MRYSFMVGCVMLIQITAAGCGLGWKQAGGVQALPEVRPDRDAAALRIAQTDEVKTPLGGKTGGSRGVAIALPDGWHWVMRGHDFMATRDGVFLQNILIERIRVDQAEQEVAGNFPLAALSSKQWPLRTVARYLKKHFAAGMSPTEAADAVLGNRANDPSVSDFEVREVVVRQIAGNQGFRAVFDFRLQMPGVHHWSPFEAQGRKTPYRSVYYGFMLDEWFYGISYSAARRHYFQKDVEAFESVLQSFRLTER